jgi:hypothetical protein
MRVSSFRMAISLLAVAALLLAPIGCGPASTTGPKKKGNQAGSTTGPGGANDKPGKDKSTKE